MRVDQALALVTAKRLHAQRQAEARRQALIALDAAHRQGSDLVRLDGMITQMRLSLLLEESPEKRQFLLAELEALRAEQMRLLDACISDLGQDILGTGPSGNSVQLSPPCPFCQDTGFAGEALCSCVRRLLLDNSLPFGRPDPACTFDRTDFSLFAGMDNHGEPLEVYIRRLYSKAQNFADDFNTGICAWTLLGAVGTGKTFLAQCIANAAQNRGCTAMVVPSYELNQTFRFGYARQAELCDSADLLVIDDLGTEPLWNNVTVEGFLGVISSRLIRRRGLVITTNLSPHHLIDRYGERLWSRLTDNERAFAVEIPGEDLRGRAK